MKNTPIAPMRGWVKTPRSLLIHPVSHNPRLLALYTTLTLMQPQDGGAITMTTRELSSQTGISRGTLTPMLRQLHDMGLMALLQVGAEGITYVMRQDIAAEMLMPATEVPSVVGGIPTAVVQKQSEAVQNRSTVDQKQSTAVQKQSAAVQKQSTAVQKQSTVDQKQSTHTSLYKEEKKENIINNNISSSSSPSSSFEQEMALLLRERGKP